MYCCTYDRPTLSTQQQYENNAMLRVVPHLLSNLNEWFSMGNSTFSMEQYKANSAR
jgi:hypothetical protein